MCDFRIFIYLIKYKKEPKITYYIFISSTHNNDAEEKQSIFNSRATDAQALKMRINKFFKAAENSASPVTVIPLNNKIMTLKLN